MGDLHGAHDMSQNQTVAGGKPGGPAAAFRRRSERASDSGPNPLQNAESMAQNHA